MTDYERRIQENINLYGDNPGARESGFYGPPGSPGFSGNNVGTLQKGPDGQTYRWNGGVWIPHNILMKIALLVAIQILLEQDL
jgi:hypothetical protein